MWATVVLQILETEQDHTRLHSFDIHTKYLCWAIYLVTHSTHTHCTEGGLQCQSEREGPQVMIKMGVGLPTAVLLLHYNRIEKLVRARF